VGDDASVDFVTRYGADGRLRATGVWDFSVDSAMALGAGEVLQSRVRRLGALLAPMGFRSRLTLSPWPRLELAEPIECQPHMVHRGNQPPVGLPDSVRTFTGRTRILAGIHADLVPVPPDDIPDGHGRHGFRRRLGARPGEQHTGEGGQEECLAHRR
jgi:hypothetical protein